MDLQLTIGLRVAKQNKGMEPIIMAINFVPLSLLMVMEPYPTTMEVAKDIGELK
jgi:hypothetical protein